MAFNQATAPLKQHHSGARSPGRAAPLEEGQADHAVNPMPLGAIHTGVSATTYAVSESITITEPATGILSAKTHVFAINNASSPRNLCIHEMNRRATDCTAFSNQRHQSLAHDWQYLQAADHSGNKLDKVCAQIDKVCVQIDSGSCLDDPPPARPAGPLLLFGAAIALGCSRKRLPRGGLSHTDRSVPGKKG